MRPLACLRETVGSLSFYGCNDMLAGPKPQPTLRIFELYPFKASSTPPYVVGYWCGFLTFDLYTLRIDHQIDIVSSLNLVKTSQSELRLQWSAF